MDYRELADQIAQAPASSRPALERLLLYTTAGGAIRPAYAAHAEGAGDYRAFFDAIYADDELRFTDVWAGWATFSRKGWIGRFEPQMALAGLRLKGDGLPVVFESGIMLAPTGSRDNIANLYVFSQGAFNVEAAEFVTSIGGTFACAGYDFAGIYGVYKYRGSVILEQWEADRAPTPSKQG